MTEAAPYAALRARQEAWLGEWRATGSPLARDALLRSVEGMVMRGARYYARVWGVDVEDLAQVGRLAVFRALDQVDLSKGTFGAFMGWKIRSAQAEHSRMTSGTLTTTHKAARSEERKAAERSVRRLDDDESLFQVAGENASALEGVAEGERARLVRELLDGLPERQARVMRGAWMEDRTLKEMGDEMGFSKEYARQLQSKALESLRGALEARGLAFEDLA